MKIVNYNNNDNEIKIRFLFLVLGDHLKTHVVPKKKLSPSSIWQAKAEFIQDCKILFKK
jgi:hypothetical protein